MTPTEHSALIQTLSLASSVLGLTSRTWSGHGFFVAEEEEEEEEEEVEHARKTHKPHDRSVGAPLDTSCH